MGKLYETSERTHDEALMTRWYKANYEQVKAVALEVAKAKGYRVVSENDSFGEITLNSGKYRTTVKIYSFNPRETSLDFYVEYMGLLDFGKTKAHIVDMYNEVNKKIDLKGLALHP